MTDTSASFCFSDLYGLSLVGDAVVEPTLLRIIALQRLLVVNISGFHRGLNVLKGADLSGKTIALFGCGDCESYSDTFVGGMGELYDAIKSSGAKIIGQVSTDGYTFDDSAAVVDGQFVGLALDDINEDDKTDTRIDAWVAQISPNL